MKSMNDFLLQELIPTYTKCDQGFNFDFHMCSSSIKDDHSSCIIMCPKIYEDSLKVEPKYYYSLWEEDRNFMRMNKMGELISQELAQEWVDIGYSTGINKTWNEHRMFSKINDEVVEKLKPEGE